MRGMSAHAAVTVVQIGVHKCLAGPDDGVNRHGRGVERPGTQLCAMDLKVGKRPRAVTARVEVDSATSEVSVGNVVGVVGGSGEHSLVDESGVTRTRPAEADDAAAGRPVAPRVRRVAVEDAGVVRVSFAVGRIIVVARHPCRCAAAKVRIDLDVVGEGLGVPQVVLVATKQQKVMMVIIRCRPVIVVDGEPVAVEARHDEVSVDFVG